MTTLKQPSTMDVHLIWLRSDDPSQKFSVAEAWDADSVDANPDGWTQVYKGLVHENGADNVRVTINFSAVEQAFEPVDVTMKTLTGYTLRGGSGSIMPVGQSVGQQQDGTYRPV